MRLGYAVLIFTGTVVFGQQSLHAQDEPAVHRVTIPMSVEGNAPIITVAFKTTQGVLRPARFLFDSGGGAIILSDGLAKELGLKAKGAVLSDDAMMDSNIRKSIYLWGLLVGCQSTYKPARPSRMWVQAASLAVDTK